MNGPVAAQRAIDSPTAYQCLIQYPLWLGIWLRSDNLAPARDKAQEAKASHEHCVGFWFRNRWDAKGDDLPMVIDSQGLR